MPSFSIEVPGEASPLTEVILVNTLQSASSTNPHQIQTGTKQLQEWEKTSGFYKHLQSAYLDHRLPIELRYLAIIQLKNGIDKYWRKTAQNAVSKEDKNVIRSRLQQGMLSEPDHRLALQDALVIAKIARYEFPSEWPNAVSGFLECIRESLPPLQQARALLALLHVVKELSTQRLIRSRQHLEAATPEIVNVVGSLYARLVSTWLSTPHGENASDMQQQSLLAIKVLRRLIVFGYENPNRNPDAVSFWNLSVEQLRSLMPLSNNNTQLLNRHIVQLAKFHQSLARERPAAFALLPGSLELTQLYWNVTRDFGAVYGSRDGVIAAIEGATVGSDGDAQHEKPVTETIALKGLLVIRACVKMVHNPTQTFKYRTPEDKEEKRNATAHIRDRLLTESFIRDVMETIVSRFFVFRTSDLAQWLEEPEEWEKREEGSGEDWEFSIRSCAEKLFLDLAINHKEVLVQPLLNVFQSVANLENEDILLKDSVYTAIGLAAPVVHERLDFDAFLCNVLVVEVQRQSPGYNILRRRAAILIGQWISVKIGEASRPLVYQIFQHLLNAEDAFNDQVVRVTAGRQLLNVANDWEFKAEQFMPYAQAILTHIMHLIEEASLTETKMALLNTISAIVERLDHSISPFAERILLLLPGLWEQSGEEHLMKQAILTILARLVTAMKSDSLPLHSIAYPIIKGAIEPDSDSQVYLLDDALDLWHALIVQTPTGSSSEEMLDLVQYLYPIFELGSESLRKALEITESYVLLAPQYMLSDTVRVRLFSLFAELLGSLKAEANGMVCNLVEAMIRAAQNLGSETAVEQVSSDLARSGLLSKIKEGLWGSWDAHRSTGPNAKTSPVDGVVETDYFCILARLTMGSLDAFRPDTETAAWLLEEWFAHFDVIGDPSRRKLMCLAVTKFLRTNEPWILLNLQSLMTVWTDLVTELREDDADATGDSLVYQTPATSEGIEGPEAAEDVRRRELMQEDAVHTIKLPQWIQQHLQHVIDASGGTFQDQWLANVDQDVVKAFSDLGIA